MSPIRSVLILTLAILSWAPWGVPAEAGWFDWMFGSQPTVANYPGSGVTLGNQVVVANRGPVYPPSNFMGGAYYPPAPIRRPTLQGNMAAVGIPAAAGGQNACNTCAQPAATTGGCNTCQPSGMAATGQTGGNTVVNSAPQVNYRTSWAQVPVTNFRPVATIDPVTGVAVTAMQPCATTQVQVRRVPTIGSWLSNLFPWHRRRTAMPVTAPCVSGCSPAVAPGCSNCTPTNTTGDYYIQPGSQPATSGVDRSVPATRAPATGAPATRGGSGADSVPATRGGSGGPEPAEQRPSLDPTGLQGASRQLNRPANSRSDRSPAAADNANDRTPFRLHHAPANANPPNNSNPNRSSLRPIPDPDAEVPAANSDYPDNRPNNNRTNNNRADERPPVPRLLNPRDRSAALERAQWGVVRATWPMPIDEPHRGDRTASHGRVLPAGESSERAAASTRELDASGWRKARP